MSSGAPSAGFTECLTALAQSKVAMWYDATSAAGSLESDESPVKGKLAYAQAPVEKTKAAGWLYAWSWAIEKKHPEVGRRLEVHFLGLREGIREPGRQRTRLVPGTGRQTGIDV